MPINDPNQMRSTEGMVDYNQNSTAQQQMVHLQAGRIRALVQKMGRVEPELKLADYGCGPGQSTVETVKPAIAAYRELYPDAPIVVCHADQPGNDWSTLFQIASGTGGYLHPGNGVRAEAAVGSFYDQMTAPGSVSLATCFAASHWLSHGVQLDAPGTVWYADLQGKARDTMWTFAREDWARFLRHRAAELQSGGHLLVATLGSTPDAGEVNGSAGSGRGIYRAMQHVAQSMADDGVLDAGVLDQFLFSLWFLTKEEAEDPLLNDPDLIDAFEICEISVTPAPVNPDDLFKDHLNDPTEYARRYVGYTRAFADSTLRKHLFEPGSPADPDAAAEEFYARLDALYQRETVRFACEIWHLVVVLKRR